MSQKPTYLYLIKMVAVVLLSTAIWEPASANSGDRPGRVALEVAGLKNANATFRPVSIARVATETRMESVEKTVRNYTLLRMHEPGLQEILASRPDQVKLSIPTRQGDFSLELYKVNISHNGFTLLTSDGRRITDPGEVVHYRGIVENDMSSVVSFSISKEETMGLISTNAGNFVFGKVEDNGDLYMIYNDKEMAVPFNFDCGTNTSNLVQPYAPPASNGISTVSTKCVDWYYETDYDIYVGKGSLSAVNNYIQGIFNQVSTLYNNDGISITLQTLYVWTTTDPYTGPSTSNYLSQFGSYRTSFSGDLATLIGYAGGGGIAYVNGLCSSGSQYKMGYAGISSNYNSVPTYSWTVEVITHEDGHLLGSRHTHDCVWNGNNTRIDGCGPAAGYNTGSCPAGPIPVDGTIMSYCHLISAGINFNLGFGPQPAALILNNVNNSNCLSSCSSCTSPAQPGTISGVTAPCPGAAQTYSVQAVSGATSYTWTLPSGWTGTSITNSITVTPGSSGGTISVAANNSCGTSTLRTLTVSISATPSQPSSITGSTTVCAGSQQTYSTGTVSGATSYIWTLPAGWTGSSSNNSITVTPGSSGGTISVAAVNACGASSPRSINTTVNNTVAAPTSINAKGGNRKMCPGESKIYNVAAVPGAASYTWTAPAGAIISSGQGTSSVTITYQAAFLSSGTLSVTANNGCGSSVATTLPVTRRNPAKPSAITGIKSGVCNLAGVPYSVSAVNDITYNWVFSSPGATITGQGTNSITASFASSYTPGTLTVTGSNACGVSVARTINVNPNPVITSLITGSNSVCANQQGVPYSISPVAGATSYTWKVPPGARINDGTVTSTTTSLTTTATSVTVNFKTTSGKVKVSANNACGTSADRSMQVGINCREGLVASNVSENAVSIYPNPANEELNLEYYSEREQNAEIRLSDVTGKMILRHQHESVEGENIITLDISNVTPGIYFLELSGMDKKEITKVIIQ